jgi:hypothetical protein
MARTTIGAWFEYFERELQSRARRDVVLRFETGPASKEDISRLYQELKQEFPTTTYWVAGGDPERSWSITAWIRLEGRAETVRQELARWASRHEPLLRVYSVRQRSLWSTA